MARPDDAGMATDESGLEDSGSSGTGSFLPRQTSFDRMVFWTHRTVYLLEAGHADTAVIAQTSLDDLVAEGITAEQAQQVLTAAAALNTIYAVLNGGQALAEAHDFKVDLGPFMPTEA